MLLETKYYDKSQDLIIIFKHLIKGNFCKPSFLFIFPSDNPALKKFVVFILKFFNIDWWILYHWN